MKLKFALFLLVWICFFNLPTFAQKKAPDKIKAVKTVTGKFVQFEQGDYMHVDIKKSNGKTESYWIGGNGLEYFMALNYGKLMVFTYEIVDTYIPESGGRMVIERLKSAKVGTLTSTQWWKDLKKKYTFEQIDKKYGDLIGKYTKQN